MADFTSQPRFAETLIQRFLASMQVRWSRISGRQILLRFLFSARLFRLEVYWFEHQLPYFQFSFSHFLVLSNQSQVWHVSCLALRKLNKSLNSWMNKFRKVEKLTMWPLFFLLKLIVSQIHPTFSSLKRWSQNTFFHGFSHGNNGIHSLRVTE